MDFQKLFDEIGFAKEGVDSFYAIHARCADPAFCEALNKSFEAYDQGLEAFSAYLEEFAAKEQLQVEVLNLYIYLRLTERTLAEYRRRGYDDAVFYDTMKDFTIDCRFYYETCGIYGISPKPHRWWLTFHLNNEIYRFGRLQYTFKEAPYDFEVEGRLIKKGEIGLSAHISRYEPLDDALCEDSYARAREFAKEHLNMPNPFFFCDSWLMHPWIREDLGETSRIAQFQSRYTMLSAQTDYNAVIKQVFGEPRENPEDYPEDSSLRRAAKKRILEGKPMGMGFGAKL